MRERGGERGRERDGGEALSILLCVRKLEEETEEDGDLPVPKFDLLKNIKIIVW